MSAEPRVYLIFSRYWQEDPSLVWASLSDEATHQELLRLEAEAKKEGDLDVQYARQDHALT